MPTTTAEARALEAIEAINKLSRELEDAKAAVFDVLARLGYVNDEYGAAVVQHLHSLKRQHRPEDLIPLGAEKPIHVGDVSLPWLRPVNGANGEITWHGGHLYHLEPQALDLGQQ